MSVRHNPSQLFRIVALLAGLLMIAAAARPGFAQETVIRSSFLFPEREPVPVNVLTGQSCLIIFDQAIGRLAVSNTDTAEAVVVAPNQMMINGKASGRARFTTWSKDGEKFIFFDVDVRSNLAQIDSQVRALFPKEDIRLSQANGSVVISGNVDPKVATQVESVVQAAGFKTVNLLAQPVQGMLQVQLQVRVAEVSRNKLQDLAVSPVIPIGPGQGGYTNTGQGPWSLNRVEEGSMFGSVASNLNLFLMANNNVFMFLRALQQQGALRALAEPNLVAMNGQQASFLAGGEIPVPVVQGGGGNGGAVTIVWKEYGVRVNFKPTILDEQHIRLEIEPEVSTLDYNNALRFEGFLVPALRTRRAKTGIELRDGQSFGIAGLLDNSETRSLAKIPVLSSVPVLGNLFKSKSFNKNETELVFIVTAKVTEPLNPDAVPNMKGIDGLKGASPLGVEAPASTNNSTGGASSASENTDSDRQPDSDAKSKPASSEDSPITPIAPIDSPKNDSKAPPPPPRPAATPPQKVITKRQVEGLNWKLRMPQAPTLTARNAEEKTHRAPGRK
jgi:pilus assembly protein CpaC